MISGAELARERAETRAAHARVNAILNTVMADLMAKDREREQALVLDMIRAQARALPPLVPLVLHLPERPMAWIRCPPLDLRSPLFAIKALDP